MSDQDPCVICDTTAEKIHSREHGNNIHWKCPRCGEFRLLASACSLLSKSNAASRAKIFGYVSDQNRDKTVPTITRDVLEQVLSRALPTVGERADRLLLEALRGQNRLGQWFNIAEPRFVAATYSQDTDEVEFLCRMLSDRGFMGEVDKSGTWEVLPDGYMEADQLTRKVAQSNKGFVAMWFDDKLASAYSDGFQIAVMKAGYDPIRVDRVEHVNRIDDEIIAQIRISSFVVADFTGHRGGVYFEAGFALGLDLPVIWTCRKDHMHDLHFDIRQYNTIDWETHDELSSRLQHRIEATVGKGPKAVSDS